MPKRNDPTLADIGEWGFLSRILPRLQRRSRGAFLVPPGDDAAVLAGGERPVLSIDALTEGTHFRSGWDVRVRHLLGVPLARALAWKLLGGCVSDLASMGATSRRWAMVYLGAPGATRLSWLNDLYKGIDESARSLGCVLSGGDTVRAREVTMVAAVGGRLEGRALTRRGARPGMLWGIVGQVGDAAAGLRVLDGKAPGHSRRDARHFVERFFRVRPQLEMGKRLSREKGVGGAMDVSDALSDCLSIFCRDSNVGGDIEIDSLPTSSVFKRHFGPTMALSGGEDYALLFAATPRAANRLARSGAAIIGRVREKRHGLTYRYHGRPVPPPRSFQHF